jgi:hypothetical protein
MSGLFICCICDAIHKPERKYYERDQENEERNVQKGAQRELLANDSIFKNEWRLSDDENFASDALTCGVEIIMKRITQ